MSHGIHGSGHPGRALGHAKHGSGKFKARGGSGEHKLDKKSGKGGPGEAAAAPPVNAMAELDKAIAAIRAAVESQKKDSVMGVSAAPTSRIANPLPTADQFQPRNALLDQPSGGAPAADATVKSGGGLASTGGGGLAGGIEGTGFLGRNGGGGLAGGIEGTSFLSRTGGGGLAGGIEG
jgi:hypothetical protein